MPIISITGPEAVRIRKANTLAGWGNRMQENRVEPIARPGFDVPFRLIPGEKIFTIGSCFARNVEAELIERGFRIPMRELFETPEFEGLPPGIVNNFGTPSIFNELAWAFGEVPFDEDKAIFQLGEDKYIDLHMINSIRPDTYENVIARRRGLLRATRSLAECRVVIATLGLAEIWWDEEAGVYLNTAPLPGTMRSNPERFSLHVLNFGECLDYLERALAIAFAHGRDDLRVILTVSPVPLMATHRLQDVITANSYSKSLLRTVAEHVVANHACVTYFPSYESVTLSDRRFAWMDDMVHATREIVEFNVERMVNAYTGQGDEKGTTTLLGSEDASVESATSLMLAEMARQARVAGDDSFFDEHADAAMSSPAMAMEFARFQLEKKNHEEALALIEPIRTGAAMLLRADVHLSLGQYAEAIDCVTPLCRNGVKGVKHWKTLIEASAHLEGSEGAIAAENRWQQAVPRETSLASAVTGRYLAEIGAHEDAISRLRDVYENDERAPGWTGVLYAKSMIAMGDHQGALAVLDSIKPRTTWQVRQIGILRLQVKDALIQTS